MCNLYPYLKLKDTRKYNNEMKVNVKTKIIFSYNVKLRRYLARIVYIEQQ
jgi:hypothetical protein